MSRFEKKLFRCATVSEDSHGVDRRRLLATVAALAASVVTAAAAPRAAAAAQSVELGTVWWTELQTPDLERARAFYTQTLGWTSKVVALRDMTRSPATDEKQYILFMADGRDVAGAAQFDESAAEDTVASWLTYIQVGNVDAATLKAVELGAKLLEPPTDVPNAGRIAVIQDPSGARICLITVA